MLKIAAVGAYANINNALNELSANYYLIKFSAVEAVICQVRYPWRRRGRNLNNYLVYEP